MRQRGGFTLLELLMVIIIIAILAAIAIPQYTRLSERARASEALQYLGAIRSSELRQKALTTSYAALTSLDITVTNSTTWGWTVNTSAGGDAQATRVGGAADQVINMDLDNGTTCSGNAVYGLNVTTC